MSWVLICLTVLLTEKFTSAQNGTTESVQEADEVVTTVSIPSSSTSKPVFQRPKSPCSCEEGQCGCCTGAILDRFRQKVCANFTYEPDDFALTTSLSLNERVLLKNTVTGKNPPPMCVRVPRLQFIRLCVRFYNIYFAKRNVHLCIDMDANWEDLTLIEWSLDCIRMGAGGFAIVGPEEGGGFPASPVDQEEQTDEDYDDSARNAPYSINDKRRAKTAIEQNKVIFDSSLSCAASKKPDKAAINIERALNGDFLVSYAG